DSPQVDAGHGAFRARHHRRDCLGSDRLPLAGGGGRGLVSAWSGNAPPCGQILVVTIGARAGRLRATVMHEDGSGAHEPTISEADCCCSRELAARPIHLVSTDSIDEGDVAVPSMGAAEASDMKNTIRRAASAN